MNDKQQLAAMGEHMAEQVGQSQPLCMAKRIEELEAQVRVMAGLMREAGIVVSEAMPFFADARSYRVEVIQGLRERIEAALIGKPQVPAETITETIRTAPERIWLQVGDQAGDHDYPFPEHGDGVSWCAEQVMPCEVPYVRADLVGHVPAPAIPEGWQLVPVWPTHDMLHVVINCRHFDVVQPEMAGKYYRAMLAASPKPEDK